jgi:hypothetical protein
MKRIFISYSRLDRDFARRLAKSLAELGADVWIDYEDIAAGRKWSSAIQEGLDTSDGLLVVISPDSMASSNVEDEWQYFLDSGKPVIPILYKAAKFHFQLHRLQYIDFSNQRFGDSFGKLLDELKLKGIPLLVEEAEDTAIVDLRRSKPPKKDLAYIPESQLPTAPSIRVKKPILERTEENKKADTGSSLRPVMLPLLLIAGLSGILAALIYFLGGPPVPSPASLDDFESQPFSVYFYEEDFEVYRSYIVGRTATFDSVYVLERFEAEGEEWFKLYEQYDEVEGYQTGNALPVHNFLLKLVPVARTLETSSVLLYTRPANSASSLEMTISPDILVYGYRYDDASQLWYYVFVETDETGVMGWIKPEDDTIDLVGEVPAMAYTLGETFAYWDQGLEEEDAVFTLPEGELIRVVGQDGEYYKIAFIHEEDWQLFWVDGDKLDINETTKQFLEQE